MAAYCILRCEKLTTRGNFAASIEHTFRTRPTPNADPARTHLNRTIGAESKEAIFEQLDARLAHADEIRLAVTGKKTQANAVMAIEYLITASPEWMKGRTPAEVDAFFAGCQRWLVAKHGAENVLSTTVQFDEGSPHMTAYVVPIAQEGRLAGTLNASAFMGGKKMLSDMQTDFHVQVGKPLGLERGIEGSNAKHDRVDRFYGAMQRPTPAVTTPLPPAAPKPTLMQQIAEGVGVATEHTEAVAKRAVAAKKRAAESRAVVESLTTKANAHDATKGKEEAREALLQRLKAEANALREIPLRDVLERLGCTIDPDDKRNWKTPAGRLMLQKPKDGDTKFVDPDTGKGGGGAIDLVMHVEDLDFAGAKRWLLDTFGAPALLGAIVATAKREVAQLEAQPRPPYKAPEPAPARWERVRAYLVDVRRLAARLVDVMHDAGRIYADARSNVVFPLTSTDGELVGVELRGTGPAAWHGTSGKKGVFDLAAIGDDRRVAFVESPIEALSLRDLGFAGRVISFGGSAEGMHQIYAGPLAKAGFEVLAAFNADAAGDAMSTRLKQAVPAVGRLRPASTKDWNDELVARARAATPPDVEQSAPAEDPPAPGRTL
jgi:hypothetical protein